MADALINLDELSFIDDTDEEAEPEPNADITDKSPRLQDTVQGTSNSLKHSKSSSQKKEVQGKLSEVSPHTIETKPVNDKRQPSEACDDREKLIVDSADHISSYKKEPSKKFKEKQTPVNDQESKSYPVHVEVTVKENNMEKSKNSSVVTVELHKVAVASKSKDKQKLQTKDEVVPSTSKQVCSVSEPKVPKQNNEVMAGTAKGPELLEYDDDIGKEAFSYVDDFSFEDSYRTESVTSPELSQSDTLRSLPDFTMYSYEDLPTSPCSDSQTSRDFHRLRDMLHQSPTKICSDSQTSRDLRKIREHLQESNSSISESFGSSKDAGSSKGGHRKKDNEETTSKNADKSTDNTDGDSKTNAERPSDISGFASNGAPRRSSRKQRRSIRIVVTNDEGVDEHTEDISQASRNSSRGDFSPDSDSSGGSLSVLKKICAQRKTSVVEEFAKKKKTKPFNRLQKLSRGCYEVGIEGDRKRCNIKAITLLKDKRIVMFDRNNKCLKLFDKDFVPLDRLSIPNKFCALASVFEHTIAVTLPEEKRLQLFHVDKNKFEEGRVHPMEAEFYSVAHYKGRLYLLKRTPKSALVDYDNWQIVSLDMNKSNTDSIKTMRSFIPGHQDNTLLANSSGLYMTHKLENEILHLGHDGSFKLRYKIDMSLPMGITSDRYGNIYVCGGSVTSFIEIFKFNLKGSRIIYHKTSSDPVAMCFDKQDNLLFVCDKIAGNVMKYKIEHNGTIQGLMKSFAMGVNI